MHAIESSNSYVSTTRLLRKKTSARPQRYRKIVTRIVTVVGAMLVFATFVYKDVLREKQRDLLDGVTNARLNFSIRNGLILLSDRVRQIEGGISESHSSSDRDDRLDITKRSVIWRSQDLSQLLDSVGSLCDALPQPTHAPLSPFKTEAEGIQSDIEKLKKSQDPARGRDEDTLNHWEDIKKREATLKKRVQDPIESILDRADHASKEAGKRYSRFSRLSVALYILGFIVGLIAHAVGINGVPSEE
jgi:hypothetical protein